MEVLSKVNAVGTWVAFVGSVIAIILAAVGEFIAVKRKFQEELNKKALEKAYNELPCTIEKVTISLEKKKVTNGSVGED